MKKLDRAILFFTGAGFWALVVCYFFAAKPAESQDFLYEVKEAVNNCIIAGRVKEDFYGAHRLQADIDCGPSWIE